MAEESSEPTAVMPKPDFAGQAAGAAADVSEGVLEIEGEWRLHHGGRLPGARIAWRLAGSAAAPLVCAMGGIWCDRRIADCAGQRGGWREIVGPARPLDSVRYRVLSFDYLGGRGDSSGPGPGASFPSVSTYDQADALARVLDHLKVPALRAILGGSYGGMVALAFAERYPERVASLCIISAADRAHPMAVAWHSIQRQIVRFALECGRSGQGLRLARAVGLSLYRSSEEFVARFPAVPRLAGERFVFPVESYLFEGGDEAVAGFRAEAFLCLCESLDLHHVDASRIFVPTTAVGVREDQLVPLSDVRALVARMASAHLREISSIHGHDAYLREAEQLRGILASAIG